MFICVHIMFSVDDDGLTLHLAWSGFVHSTRLDQTLILLWVGVWCHSVETPQRTQAVEMHNDDKTPQI